MFLTITLMQQSLMASKPLPSLGAQAFVGTFLCPAHGLLATVEAGNGWDKQPRTGAAHQPLPWAVLPALLRDHLTTGWWHSAHGSQLVICILLHTDCGILLHPHLEKIFDR